MFLENRNNLFMPQSSKSIVINTSNPQSFAIRTYLLLSSYINNDVRTRPVAMEPITLQSLN